ncbi:PQQ-like beta-propeller repeat protein [bacterium]|nr:PQQ-like beta-propeller repeat protein [bacterium]
MWKTSLKGPLTAPVAAGGMLITACPEAHAVHALNAGSGELIWSFTAGAAVDSPPTVHRNAVLFGCADGWVYCLRAKGGELAWRFRAAPVDRRIVAYGRVESTWPVHGSVLVQDGIAYAVAGRTTAMDGLCFYALDAVTGKTLVERKIAKASFPDVLSSDGISIFMRHMRLDKQGVVRAENVPHLFSSAGFLDSTWWHRTYWQFGTSMSGGYTSWFASGERRNSGRLMVKNRDRIYGFGRRNQYTHVGSHVGLGKTKYLLYAAGLPEAKPEAPKPKTRRLPWNQKKPDLPSLWTRKIALLARGMVLSDKILFVAGPPDLFGVAPEDSPHPYTRASAEALQAQREALEGRAGALLWAVAVEDGKKLHEYKLKTLPAWDGLIAARGRLYLTMQDGTIACFSGKAD